MTRRARYRCRTCQAEFAAWAPAERHADETHHARIEVIVRPMPQPRTPDPALPNEAGRLPPCRHYVRTNTYGFPCEHCGAVVDGPIAP